MSVVGKLLFALILISSLLVGCPGVLRPDPVMGEAAWTREVREANNRTREKPNVRNGIDRGCSA